MSTILTTFPTTFCYLLGMSAMAWTCFFSSSDSVPFNIFGWYTLQLLLKPPLMKASLSSNSNAGNSHAISFTRIHALSWTGKYLHWTKTSRWPSTLYRVLLICYDCRINSSFFSKRTGKVIMWWLSSQPISVGKREKRWISQSSGSFIL